MPKESSTCHQCNTTFTFNTLSSTGKFCSSRCAGDSKVSQTRNRVFEGKVHDRTTLKRFLINEHGEKCANCGIGAKWNGMPLSLQVDHIDGNSDNDLPSNLRLLCPNCHSQTETFSGRNKAPTKRSKYMKRYRSVVDDELEPPTSSV